MLNMSLNTMKYFNCILCWETFFEGTFFFGNILYSYWKHRLPYQTFVIWLWRRYAIWENRSLSGYVSGAGAVQGNQLEEKPISWSKTNQTTWYFHQDKVLLHMILIMKECVVRRGAMVHLPLAPANVFKLPHVNHKL